MIAHIEGSLYDVEESRLGVEKHRHERGEFCCQTVDLL